MIVNVVNSKSKKQRVFVLDKETEQIINKHGIDDDTIQKICSDRKDSAEIKVVFKKFDDLSEEFNKEQLIKIMKSNTSVVGNLKFLENDLKKIRQIGFSNEQISIILGRTGGYNYLQKIVSETDFFNQDLTAKTKKANAAYAMVYFILVISRKEFCAALEEDQKNNNYDKLLEILNRNLKALDNRVFLNENELSQWIGDLKRIAATPSSEEYSTFFSYGLTPATTRSIQLRKKYIENKAKNKSSTIDNSNATSSSSSNSSSSSSSSSSSYVNSSNSLVSNLNFFKFSTINDPDKYTGTITNGTIHEIQQIVTSIKNMQNPIVSDEKYQHLSILKEKIIKHKLRFTENYKGIVNDINDMMAAVVMRNDYKIAQKNKAVFENLPYTDLSSYLDSNPNDITTNNNENTDMDELILTEKNEYISRPAKRRRR